MITREQFATLTDLVCKRSLVLDRVYYDKKNDSVNFRCNIDPLSLTGIRALDPNKESIRFAIMDDGTVVNRNQDYRFTWGAMR